MKEKFLIRMMTWKDKNNYPTMLKALYSNKITEFLKLYVEAKDYGIPIEIDNESEGYVTDIKISFGGHETDNKDDNLTTLDIYVEVI